MTRYTVVTDNYTNINLTSVPGEVQSYEPYVDVHISHPQAVSHNGIVRFKLSLSDAGKLQYYLTECLKDVAIINV